MEAAFNNEIKSKKGHTSCFEIVTFKSVSVVDGNKLNSIVKLDPQHPIFVGHFPGNPILPGVILIEMLKDIVERSLGTDLMLCSASSIKFLYLIDPRQENVFSADVLTKPAGNAMVVDAIFHWGTHICFKFSGEFIALSQMNNGK